MKIPNLFMLLSAFLLQGGLMAQNSSRGNAGEECIMLDGISGQRILEDISYLASDELQGREPGTEGAELAAAYLMDQFRRIGLAPAFQDQYEQAFRINSRVEMSGDGNILTVEGKSLELKKDFFPLSYSSNGSVKGETVFAGYGIETADGKHNDYKRLKAKKRRDKIFVIDISSPDGIHPHSKYLPYHPLSYRVEKAVEMGARGVIFINGSGEVSDPSVDFRDHLDMGVPVIFVQNEAMARRLRKAAMVEIHSALEQQQIEAQNIGAYLNNGADQIIVIGAHYDHLGMGGRSSLYRGEAAMIHNGADDNASGVAGMLELARQIHAMPELFTQYNFLFLGFSGEEWGLLGSSWFTKKLPVEREMIAAMINLDMIGRLEENTLAINGVGTSPLWEKLLKQNACKKLQIKTSESGVGPSDHSSFYYLDVPVLHFFSGTHADYHKPTDDVERINVQGIEMICSYILTLCRDLQNHPRPEFTATAGNMDSAPRFTVTLGVLPDYMYSGKGMKIDGVTEGKAAYKAGLKAGDIVVRMGDVPVVDMMSYMKALSAFKAGEQTTVTYEREGKTMKAKVQF